MTRQVLAIGGVLGSGKDTVGLMLKERAYFYTTAFADPIKRMAKVAFPIIKDEWLWGPSELRGTKLPIDFSGLDPRDGTKLTRVSSPESEDKWWMARDGRYYPRYLTVRLLLQTLGTEWGRRLHPNIWVDSCFDHIEIGSVYPGMHWAITDMRFRNEVVGTRARGGLAIKLLRGFDEALEKMKTNDNASAHISEAEFLSIPDSEFDYVLDNRGTLEELPDALEEMLRKLPLRKQ